MFVEVVQKHDSNEPNEKKSKYASSDIKNSPLKSKEVSYVKPIISNISSEGKETNSTSIDSSNISTNEKNIEDEYFML